MGKIKRIFSNISVSIKQTYSRFPLTMIIIYVLTIILVFCQELIKEIELIQHLLFILSISLIGIFYLETKTDNKTNRIIGTVISVIIAIIFDRILALENDSFEFFCRLLIAYLISIPALSIYNLIKKSGVKTEEYSIKAFANICKCSITYAVLNIGICIVMSIFIVLILDGEHWTILLKILGLLLGMYYIPALINSFSDMETEVGKFIKGLILYVVTPLITALVAIIYIYLLKISISGELLHKAIFFILALIFTLAFPIVVMLKNYEESKIIKNIINILTYAYIPFIFLEIYSMSIRVSDYGVTPSRYMGYMLVFFEIAFILLLIIKKSEHLNKSIICFVILVLIGSISPFNVIEFSARSQANRLNKIIETANGFNNLSEKDKEKCIGAYKYLRSEYDDYITVSGNEVEAIKTYMNNKYDYSYSSQYIYGNKKIDGFDISKYKKMYETSFYSRDTIDCSNIILNSRNNEIQVKADLSNYLIELINIDKSLNEEVEKEFEENNIVEIDNGNFDLYLTYISITYDKDTNKVTNLSLSGYLFEN